MFRIMVVEVCDATIVVYLTFEAKERARGICTICGEGPVCSDCCTSSNNACLMVYLTLEANGRTHVSVLCAGKGLIVAFAALDLIILHVASQQELALQYPL